MKKVFITLFIIIILIVSSLFALVFTKTGNNLIASYIENKVNEEQNKVELKVNNLDIGFKNINFNATIDDNSNIDINGFFDIFKKSVDLKYDIKIKDLSNLQSLINRKLNGPFSTSGTFIGNKQSCIIKGISDIASSESKYDLELVDFNPSNINFEIKSAKIEELLHLLNEPIYARGILNLIGDVKNADIENLDGKITANIEKGKIINEVINKTFKQNISTSIFFKAQANSILKENKAILKTSSNTSLADIYTKNTVIDLKKNTILTDFLLEIKNLSKLETIIGKKLNGAFETSGELYVKDKTVKITGKSNIVDSQTNYDVKIENDKARYLKVDIKNAKVDKLLSLINEPVYAKGDLNIQTDIKNTDLKKLDGEIKANIKNGLLINKVVNTVFNINLNENTHFSLNSNNNLKDENINTNTIINTTLGNITLTKGKLNILKNNFISNYKVDIPNLNKLQGVTPVKMRGNLNLTGKIKSKNKLLNITGTSKLLGGSLDFLVDNDILTANLKDAKVKDLTYMLYYPEIFDSKSSFNLKYNLLDKKGKLTGELLKGHFLPNEFSMLINQFSKFDLTREIYDDVKIDTNINKSKLKSIVNMKSKNTRIDITNSTIDLDNNLIDADIKSIIKKVNLNAKLKGNINNPRISIDTKALLKGKVDKNLDKLIDEKIKNEDTKELIKGIKSLFK